MRTLPSFKDIHATEKIVVCGCGASLNDFEAPERFVTIGVNDVGRRLHPKYLMVCNLKKDFPPERWHAVEHTHAEYVFTHHPLFEWPHDNLVRLRHGVHNGTDFSDPNVLHYTNTSTYMALCLAVHMGARLIGLMGIDYTPDHFFGKTGRYTGGTAATVDPEFRRLNDALVARGVKVVNLSQQSLLTAFPKMPLEEFANLKIPPMSLPQNLPRRIVSYSVTPVVGIPAILSRCINTQTAHYSRCMWAGNGYGNGTEFDGDISWNQSSDACDAELARADVVIVHNGKTADLHRDLLATKPVLTVAHNGLWNVDQCYLQKGHRGVVVGQYQATLPEFTGWPIVPNPIPIWELPYQPGRKEPITTICFTPSVKHGCYPPSHQLHWHSKGYEATMKILQELHSRWPIQLEVIRDRQIPHSQALAMKRRAHIVIDECATGGYHVSSLEGLATGCVVVNGLGERSAILETLRSCVGREVENPFTHATLETLSQILISLIQKGPDELALRGAQNRRWMEQHWNFERQWKRFWMPAIDQTIEHKHRTKSLSQQNVSTGACGAQESLDVSVIVVALNEGEDLRRTIENLTLRIPKNGEIIVVDDGSTDGSADFVTGWDESVILLRPGARLGVARARNLAAERARGNTLVFCDAHITVPDDCFDPLLNELSDETVGAVAPGITIMGQTRQALVGYGQRWRDATLDVDWMDGAGLSSCQVPLLGRAFIAMRRDLFDSVQGYDTCMIHWGAEDSELCIRLWTFGYECRVLPTIAVEHRFRPQHPYEVSWEAVLYNKLRLATLHFSAERLARVIQRLQKNPAFPQARKRLGSTDVESRRKYLWTTRSRDDEWFFRKFARSMTPELW